jgi:hypothetical protein
VKDVGLSESFQLTPDQRPGILHDIRRPNGMNWETISTGGLKAMGICLLLLCWPESVRDMPDIFDDSEQNCVQNFDWGVLCGIKT